MVLSRGLNHNLIFLKTSVCRISYCLVVAVQVNDENLQVSGRMKSDFKYLF